MQEGEEQAREGAGRGEAGEYGSDGRSRAWEEQSREGQARGRVEAGGNGTNRDWEWVVWVVERFGIWGLRF